VAKAFPVWNQFGFFESRPALATGSGAAEEPEQGPINCGNSSPAAKFHSRPNGFDRRICKPIGHPLRICVQSGHYCFLLAFSATEPSSLSIQKGAELPPTTSCWQLATAFVERFSAKSTIVVHRSLQRNSGLVGKTR
jgi:hypothetical protein